MTRPAARLLIALSALLLGTPSRAETRVVLRGASTPLEAPVESLSRAGVHIGGDQARIIGWDSVKIIIGDLADDPETSTFMTLGDRAWRARLRLSRGDLALAEPLFEELHAEFDTAPGPTALMIAEGLLRCRLRRGDQAGAIEPWLDAVAMREAGDRVAGDPPLMPVLDPDLMVPAALPPIWLADGATATLLATPAPPPTETDAAPSPETGAGDLASDFRALYVAAARFEVAGVAPEHFPEVDHPGATLVREIVVARVGDETQRARARAALEAGLDRDGGWREAWRRAALGRSLLRETDEEQRIRGVLHLLHLPARFGASQPYLTGVALAEASLELERMGDGPGAAALRRVLERSDPNHPAITWLAQQRHALTSPRPAPDQQD